MSGRRELRLVRGEALAGEAAEAEAVVTDAEGTAAGEPSSKRSPLDVVMDSVRAGTGDPLSISLLTGLEVSVVRACLDHLVRTGRLRAEVLASACSGVCGGCPATQLGCGDSPAAQRPASGGHVRGLRVIGLSRR